MARVACFSLPATNMNRASVPSRLILVLLRKGIKCCSYPPACWNKRASVDRVVHQQQLLIACLPSGLANFVTRTATWFTKPASRYRFASLSDCFSNSRKIVQKLLLLEPDIISFLRLSFHLCYTLLLHYLLN